MASVFGKKIENSILLPELPMSVRNDCQSGRWVIGSKEYDSKGLEIAVVKFTPLFGTLGKTEKTRWGQVWFVAEAGELPKGVVMVTYIKTQSLREFNNKVLSVMVQGVDPGNGLFLPSFVKKSSTKPDDKGVQQQVNYYSLVWDWKPRKTPEELARLAQVDELLEYKEAMPEIAARFIDKEGEALMEHDVPSEVPMLNAEEVPALAPAQ